MKKNKNNSKIKGKNGERELCNIFKQYFGKNYDFIRVPNSGAYFGGVNSNKINESNINHVDLLQGDLIMPDDLKNILVEVKFYKEFPFHSLINSDKNYLFDSWIEQIQKTNKNNKKIWFLCLKVNRKGWFISFDETYMKYFNLKNYIKYTSLYNNITCILTDLQIFLSDNKNIILDLSKNKDNIN